MPTITAKQSDRLKSALAVALNEAMKDIDIPGFVEAHVLLDLQPSVAEDPVSTFEFTTDIS